MAAPTTVEEYLEALPPDRRAGVEALRATIRAAAPMATETVSYEIPGVKVDGRLVLSYAGFAKHYSLFPASDTVREALGDELGPYLSGKGTIRFPADRPIPLALVTRFVEVRLAEHAARGRR
jgi:uncharacterized protein YdhG (YjbR/CyaY superfamily)